MKNNTLSLSQEKKNHGLLYAILKNEKEKEERGVKGLKERRSEWEKGGGGSRQPQRSCSVLKW